LNNISTRRKLNWFEVKSRFFEIGSFNGLKDFEGFINGK